MTAVALRTWHIHHGLPDFTEEAQVFRKALELWGPAGGEVNLNPHWFVYPSLTIYLQFLVQRLYCTLSGLSRPADFLLSILVDPSGVVVTARTLGVAADVATLLLVGHVARRFGHTGSIIAMGVVAFAPTLILTSRLIYTDSVMCALSMAAVDRMLVYRERGGWVRLAVAGVFVGLAVGAKYPAVFLFVPLAAAAWQREVGSGVVRAWVNAGVAATIAFLATTPYVIASWSEFTRDAVTIGDVTAAGGLGKLSGFGFLYCVTGLARNLGWIGVGVLTVSLIGAVRRPSTGCLRILWIAWFAIFVPNALVRVEAERYLVPIIAMSAILVGAGAERALEMIPKAARHLARPGLVVLVGAPLVWSGMVAAASGRNSTQIEARKWCEAHLAEDDLLLSEAYGPNLLTFKKKAQVQADPIFRNASPAAQLAYRSQRAFHMVWLPLAVRGHVSVRLPSPDSPELTVYPHVVDWNGAVYDLRILAGVDFVATTGAVRGRFELDTLRFREQRRFYAFLDNFAERVAAFESGAGIDGPTITIYRLTSGARQAIARAGGLDSLWWTRTVPDKFKHRMDRTLSVSERQPDPIPGLPSWALPLRGAYAERYGPFANELAENLADLGRLEPAGRLCVAGLTVLPEDVWAVQVFAYVAGRLGKWTELESALGRSIAILSRYGPTPSELLLQRADALVGIGNRMEAQRLLLGVLQSGDSAASRAAEERLMQLGVSVR